MHLRCFSDSGLKELSAVPIFRILRDNARNRLKHPFMAVDHHWELYLFFRWQITKPSGGCALSRFMELNVQFLDSDGGGAALLILFYSDSTSCVTRKSVVFLTCLHSTPLCSAPLQLPVARQQWP